MRFTDGLRREHRLIDRALAILDVLADQVLVGHPLDVPRSQELARALRAFVDEQHDRKEEDLLFAAMGRHGLVRPGPVTIMRNEHTEARHLLDELDRTLTDPMPDAERGARFLAAARGYSVLVRQHMLKEDTFVFPMAERLLPAQEQERLEKAMRSAGRRAEADLEHLQRLADRMLEGRPRPKRRRATRSTAPPAPASIVASGQGPDAQ